MDNLTSVDFMNPREALKALSDLLSEMGGSMNPPRVLESFTTLARVLDLYRNQQEGCCPSGEMLAAWMVVASLPWAIEHGLPSDALIQCWKLVSERLRREHTSSGWWPLANRETLSQKDWEMGASGSYHVGPYSQYEIPGACRFGISNRSYPDWRVIDALEEQLAWFELKLKRAEEAGEGPWNPLPNGRDISHKIGKEYRSVFRGYFPHDCGIGSPIPEEVWDRAVCRKLPSIEKEFELKALRDAILNISARLMSLKERVAAERKSDEDLIEANASLLSRMSHGFREIGVL